MVLRPLVVALVLPLHVPAAHTAYMVVEAELVHPVPAEYVPPRLYCVPLAEPAAHFV